MSDLDILNYILANVSESGHDVFNWSFVIKHVINLLILIGILVYFTRMPIKKALEKRRSNLSREIDEAQKEIDSAKKRFDEYSEKLNNLEPKISLLKESIQDLAENERNDVIAQAEQTRRLLEKEFKETIELEAFRAKQEIQQEVVTSSVKLAEKLIKEKMGDKYNSVAVDKLVIQIEGGKWLH